MTMAIQPSEVRSNLVAFVKQRGETLASLSRRIGKRSDYLSQFIQSGSPETLPDRVRLTLAMALNVDERLLGARDPWVPGR